MELFSNEKVGPSSRGERIRETIAPVGSMSCVEDVCIFLVTCHLVPFLLSLFSFDCFRVWVERDQKAISVCIWHTRDLEGLHFAHFLERS